MYFAGTAWVSCSEDATNERQFPQSLCFVGQTEQDSCGTKGRLIHIFQKLHFTKMHGYTAMLFCNFVRRGITILISCFLPWMMKSLKLRDRTRLFC